MHTAWDHGRFFYIAVCTPYNCGDDIYWLLNLQSKNIFQRPLDIYFNLNGRLTCNLLNALFALFPRNIWCGLNALAFALLLKLMGDLICKSDSEKISLYAISTILLLRYDSVFWYCGSMNYLWPALFAISCIHLFIRNPLFIKTSPLHILLKCFALFLAGITVGTTHELIGLTGLFLLFIYWMRTFLRTRTINPNARLILTIGFAIGALSVILSPGGQARAGGLSFFLPEDFLFAAAAKFRACIRCFEFAPLAIVTCFFAFKFLIHIPALPSRQTSVKWWSVACLTMMAGVILLSDGEGRTSWFLTLLSIMSAFELLRNTTIFGKPSFTVTSVILAVTLLTTSCFAASMKSSRLQSALDENEDILICDDTKLPFPLCLFDRSFRILGDIFSEYGAIDDGRTPTFWSRYTKRPTCVLLPPDLEAAVRSHPKWVGTPENMLPKLGNWYHQPKTDFIASEYTGDLTHGSKVLAKIEYATDCQISLWQRIRARAFHEGYTQACAYSPVEELQGGGGAPGIHNVGFWA